MYPFRRLCRDSLGFYNLRPDLALYALAMGAINSWLAAVPTLLHSILWPLTLLILNPLVCIALVDAYVSQTTGEEALVRLARRLVQEGLDKLFDTMSRVIGLATLTGLGMAFLLSWVGPGSSSGALPASMAEAGHFPPLLELLLMGLVTLPIMQAATLGTDLNTRGLGRFKWALLRNWHTLSPLLAIPLLLAALCQLAGAEAWVISGVGTTLLCLFFPTWFWLVMTDARVPAGQLKG